MTLTTATISLYKSNPKFVSKLKAYSRICGIVAFIIGSIVLYGWIFDIPLLKNLHPAFVSMKVNTAIAIMLAGVAGRGVGATDGEIGSGSGDIVVKVAGSRFDGRDHNVRCRAELRREVDGDKTANTRVAASSHYHLVSSCIPSKSEATRLMS